MQKAVSLFIVLLKTIKKKSLKIENIYLFISKNNDEKTTAI
jgi:hypothetical protein